MINSKALDLATACNEKDWKAISIAAKAFAEETGQSLSIEYVAIAYPVCCRCACGHTHQKYTKFPGFYINDEPLSSWLARESMRQ